LVWLSLFLDSNCKKNTRKEHSTEIVNIMFVY
jgi:hypothetical protein